MSLKMRRLLQVVGFAVVVAAPGIWAQEAPPLRVRGTIERLDGPIYVVKNRDGAELKLTLADKPQIAVLVGRSGRSYAPNVIAASSWLKFLSECYSPVRTGGVFGWGRSVDHIRASGQNGCIQRPNTWLHPYRFAKGQILFPCTAGAVHTWH